VNYTYMSCCPKPGPLAQKIKKLSSDLKKCQQNSADQAVCCDRSQCLCNAILSLTLIIGEGLFPTVSDSVTIMDLFVIPDPSLCPGFIITYTLFRADSLFVSSLITHPPATITPSTPLDISMLQSGLCVATVTATFSLPATTTCPAISQTIKVQAGFIKT
jgi:hypothetical protein